MPNDYTKTAIKAAFIRLLNERPLNKISVKSIVDICNISRNTFYYHYQDIYDLLQATLSTVMEKALSENITTWRESLMNVTRFAMENRRAVYHIYNSANRDIYEHYLMQVCQYIVETYLNTLLGGKTINQQDREIIVTVYSCQCFGLFIDWLNNNLSDEFPQRVERLCELRKGMLEEMLERCGAE